jgi:hypothetical protein
VNQRITQQRWVEILVDDLFRAVEEPQGFFHVSDGEHFETAQELFERTRGRLQWGKEAVKRMETFLRKHGELKRARSR